MLHTHKFQQCMECEERQKTKILGKTFKKNLLSLSTTTVSLPTSVRPQSAPPCQKLDWSIQYICDQWNPSLPSLKDYETHNKKEKKEKDVCEQYNTSLPSLIHYEMHCLNAHNRYVCPVCSGSFTSKKLADKHLSQHYI